LPSAPTDAHSAIHRSDSEYVATHIRPDMPWSSSCTAGSADGDGLSSSGRIRRSALLPRTRYNDDGPPVLRAHAGARARPILPGLGRSATCSVARREIGRSPPVAHPPPSAGALPLPRDDSSPPL